MISAYTTATAADSVAVKIPPIIPPTMINGTPRAHIASFRLFANLAKLNSLKSSETSNFLDLNDTRAIREKPIRIPGKMPAINILPTDTFAIKAKMIIGILGGMITPMEPPAATMEAAKFLSYPLSFIEGIRTEPTAAVSAAAEPETPAKSILESIDVIPRPPLKCPTRDSESATSLLDIPP